MREYGAAVIGGGPAGATAAARLAEAGVPVALIEARAYPRPKTCAGAVSAKAAARLPAGFRDIVREEIHTVVFSFRGRLRVEYRHPRPYAFMVDRSEFDHYLVRRAVAAGAELVEGQRVTGVVPDRGGAVVQTKSGRYRARVVIGADGANSVVARSTGMFGRPRRGFALECAIPFGGGGVPEPGPVQRGAAYIDYGCVPGGYGWIFPKGDHVSLGIGSFSTGVRSMKRYLEAYSAAALPGCPTGSVRVVGHPVPLGGRRSPVQCGAILLAGDAAGLVDPFFGEGIHYAMQSGAVAAEVVRESLRSGAAGGLGDYQSRIDREILPELRMARVISAIFYSMPGFFHRSVVMKLKTIDWFLRTVAGEATYRTFVRWLLGHLGAEILRPR